MTPIEQHLAAKEAEAILAGHGCWNCRWGSQPLGHDVSARCRRDEGGTTWRDPEFWCVRWEERP